MRFAHLSDPHLGPLPHVPATQLFNKRILGYLNWLRGRRAALGSDVLSALVNDLHRQTPDHIAVTGDLVNLALPEEYLAAANWLRGLGSEDAISVVPGNHDAYVAGGLDTALTHWRGFMASDSHWSSSDIFPFVRVRGHVAFIGVSTAIATAPFMATGQVGAAQLERLAAILEATKKSDLCRVLLIHHPPQPGACPHYKRLIDAELLRDLLKTHGAELVLHGHTHRPNRAKLQGPNGPIPVFGVASASQSEGGHKPPAQFNLFKVKSGPTAWQMSCRVRGYCETGQIRDLEQMDFDVVK